MGGQGEGPGGRAQKAGKMKGDRAGGGGGKRTQKTGGSKLRWRVPELTPKTPGPVASAEH